MGKIRVKTLGDESLEAEQKKEAKKRKEAKKIAKAPEIEGSGQTVAVEPSEEKLANIKVEKVEKVVKEEPKKEKKAKFAKKRARSKSYQAVTEMVDKTKTYPLSEALALLPKLKRAKFDETVELHINTTEAGIAGEVTLPHGSGKQVRVAIADPSTSSGQVEELLKKIEAGNIDFDVLLATPAAMPKLAKVAKVLGPRGLMPNPKNGTITQNPESAAKKYQSGLVRFKTEAKLPVLHFAVGKVSFGDKKLTENILTVFSALPKIKVKNVTLKSTMSPGIKVNPSL